MMTYAEELPACNQIELHPYLAQKELVEFCQRHEIAVVAHCPLGRPGENTGDRPEIMETDVVRNIAEKVGRSPAQVVLQWGLSRGVCVIPKTANK